MIQHCLSLGDRVESLLRAHGERGEGAALATLRNLEPLLPFSTLWSAQGGYDAGEARPFLQWVHSVLTGQGEVSPPSGRRQALCAAWAPLLRGQEPSSLLSSQFSFPLWGAWGHLFPLWQGAFTLEGDRTSLGALQSGAVEVLACGPSGGEFLDPLGFGVVRWPCGEAVQDAWTAAAFDSSVWLHVETTGTPAGCRLSVQWVGAPEQTFFVLFLRAASACIEGTTFWPQTLQRYRGASAPVLLQDTVCLHTADTTSMELIPLAGEGDFWGAQFLLAYQVRSARTEYHFSISPA